MRSRPGKNGFQKGRHLDICLKFICTQRPPFQSESGSVAPPSVASVPSLGVAVPTTKDNPPAATPLLSLLETIANQVYNMLANTFTAKQPINSICRPL